MSGTPKTKAELIAALRRILELATVEPGCERGMEWQALGGIGYWARSALGLHEPEDLPSHTRPPHWFDADRSGFSEPRS